MHWFSCVTDNNIQDWCRIYTVERRGFTQNRNTGGRITIPPYVDTMQNGDEVHLTPELILQNTQVRAALRFHRAKLGENEAFSEVKETGHKYIGKYDEFSYVEQTAYQVVKSPDRSVIQNVWRLAHQMGTLVWHLTERDAQKRSLIADGYYVRTLLAADIVDSLTGLVRPMLQWMHPSTIPRDCTWKNIYDDTLASRCGVTYVVGWCDDVEVDYVCVPVPLTQQEMFGPVKFTVNPHIEDPPAYPRICVTCRKEVSLPQLCTKCLFANYCSKECQTNNWKKHKITCAKIERVMSGVGFNP